MTAAKRTAVRRTDRCTGALALTESGRSDHLEGSPVVAVAGILRVLEHVVALRPMTEKMPLAVVHHPVATCRSSRSGQGARRVEPHLLRILHAEMTLGEEARGKERIGAGDRRD